MCIQKLRCLATFSARHLREKTLVMQDETGVGMWQSILWPDFGKLFRRSTHAREMLIYLRELATEV